jgi:hypothetical protein
VKVHAKKFVFQGGDGAANWMVGDVNGGFLSK